MGDRDITSPLSDDDVGPLGIADDGERRRGRGGLHPSRDPFQCQTPVKIKEPQIRNCNRSTRPKRKKGPSLPPLRAGGGGAPSGRHDRRGGGACPFS